MAARKWVTGEVLRLRDMRLSGLSIRRCAGALGRTFGSVSGQLVRMGLVGKAPPWRRKSGELRWAIRRIVTRFGVTHAADILGVSRNCIYLTLKTMGSKPPYRRQV